MKVKRQDISRFLLAGMAALITLINPVRGAENKPNIVHIVADDLAWKDVGFNGAGDIKTPNIDKLATGGAKLTQLRMPWSPATLS